MVSIWVQPDSAYCTGSRTPSYLVHHSSECFPATNCLFSFIPNLQVWKIPAGHCTQIPHYTIPRLKRCHTCFIPLRSTILKNLCDTAIIPAMQENPLKRTMFPNAGPETEEEEITWHANSFRESFEKRTLDHIFVRSV